VPGMLVSWWHIASCGIVQMYLMNQRILSSAAEICQEIERQVEDEKRHHHVFTTRLKHLDLDAETNEIIREVVADERRHPEFGMSQLRQLSQDETDRDKIKNIQEQVICLGRKEAIAEATICHAAFPWRTGRAYLPECLFFHGDELHPVIIFSSRARKNHVIMDKYK